MNEGHMEFRSAEQIGDFFGNEEIAFAQFLKALFKHKKSLPNNSTLSNSQCFQHILVLTHSLAQQVESHTLATGLAEHEHATHPDLIDIDIE